MESEKNNNYCKIDRQSDLASVSSAQSIVFDVVGNTKRTNVMVLSKNLQSIWGFKSLISIIGISPIVEVQIGYYLNLEKSKEFKEFREFKETSGI